MGARAARPGGRSRARRRTHVDAGHRRAAPGRRCATWAGRRHRTRACATSTPSTDAGAVADEAPDGRFAAAWSRWAGAGDDRRSRRPSGPFAQVFSAGPARRRLPRDRARRRHRLRCRSGDWRTRGRRRRPRPARHCVGPHPRRRLRAGPDERAPDGRRATACSASTSSARRSGRPASGASRRCGATCSRRCPGEGRWETALLADGNIGIGGDPVALLAPGGRAARARDGRVVVDLAPPGTGVDTRRAWRSAPRAATSRPFPWAVVGVDAIGRGRRPRPACRLAAHPPRTQAAGSRSWQASDEPAARCRPRPTSPPGCAARRGRPGRALARHLLRRLLRDRADQPLRPRLAVPAGPVPDQPGLGLPGHPGTARHHRHGGVPLLLVKLWSVYPKLFARPPLGGSAGWPSHGGRAASIAVLVAAAIFQLATGLANSAQWYPGPSPSGPPTTPSPGSRSARSSSTSR